MKQQLLDTVQRLAQATDETEREALRKAILVHAQVLAAITEEPLA